MLCEERVERVSGVEGEMCTSKDLGAFGNSDAFLVTTVTTSVTTRTNAHTQSYNVVQVIQT